MRCPDARSAQIGSRCGIAHSFQVSEYSGEPVAASLARNLLAKDDWRRALADEISEDGPEMALVCGSELLTGAGERLTRARSRPDGLIVRHSRKTQGVRPSTDPGEEVALMVSDQLCWLDIHDATFVHRAFRNVAVFDKFAEPSSRFWIVFIIVVQNGPSA